VTVFLTSKFENVYCARISSPLRGNVLRLWVDRQAVRDRIDDRGYFCVERVPRDAGGIHRRRVRCATKCYSAATTGGMAYAVPMAPTTMKLDDGSVELAKQSRTSSLAGCCFCFYCCFRRRVRHGRAGAALLREFACATQECSAEGRTRQGGVLSSLYHFCRGHHSWRAWPLMAVAEEWSG
jgi:hypothetical protein